MKIRFFNLKSKIQTTRLKTKVLHKKDEILVLPSEPTVKKLNKYHLNIICDKKDGKILGIERQGQNNELYSKSIYFIKGIKAVVKKLRGSR